MTFYTFTIRNLPGTTKCYVASTSFCHECVLQYSKQKIISVNCHQKKVHKTTAKTEHKTNLHPGNENQCRNALIPDHGVNNGENST